MFPRGLCVTRFSPPLPAAGDLKCGNVIISQAWVPRVADLGLSNSVDRLLLTGKKGAGGGVELPAGTLRYLAPEILNGLSNAMAGGGGDGAGATSGAGPDPAKAPLQRLDAVDTVRWQKRRPGSA